MLPLSTSPFLPSIPPLREANGKLPTLFLKIIIFFCLPQNGKRAVVCRFLLIRGYIAWRNVVPTR